jgi:O-acetyl-ADP-ribose deacetylase (regulator of RNase III)
MESFSMETATISIETKSIENIHGDVLILPTVADRIDQSSFNSDLYQKAGETVLEKFRKKLPLRIGNVAVTTGGELPVERIVHIPVQTAPGVPTTEENLQVGLRSGLVTADEEDVVSVLLAPVLPEDLQDEFDLNEVTNILREDLEKYPPRHFKKILLLSGYSAWGEALQETFSSP